jgi:transposase
MQRVGIEGSGAYGAGLARFLRAAGITLIEVDRPDRKTRRRQGKSDPVDAYTAARAALAGTANGTPKTRDGLVEAIRALRVARRGAMKARTQTMNQLKALLVTAPPDLREDLRHLTSAALIETCARLRPAASGAALPHCPDPVLSATKTSMRRLARRHQHLSEEILEHDADLAVLTQAAAPQLLALKGVGPDVAGQLLVTAGDNPATRAYAERRTKEGLSKKDIMRCLKRYVSRELFPLLQTA